MRMPTSLAIGWLLTLCTPAGAQTLEVPGDFADLQTALDAAPPCTTIVVHGGYWMGLRLRKPVHLVGDPRPTIDITQERVPEPAITLDGPGAGRVELTNVGVGTFRPGFGDEVNAPGIRGGGFSALVVRDSSVSSPGWVPYNHVFPGEHGIDVDLPLVWIERSTVSGSSSAGDMTTEHHEFSNPTPLGMPGGSGIVTTGNVVLLDSYVFGGSGGGILTYASPDCGFDCPGGDAGNGVVARVLIRGGGLVEPGFQSTEWHDLTGRYCCGGNGGQRAVVRREVVLPNQRKGPRKPGTASRLLLPSLVSSPESGVFVAPVGN